MSEQEKPTEPNPPVPPSQPAASPEKPDRIQLMREKAGRKPQQPVGKVPSLEKEQSYGFGKKIDAFDDGDGA